MKYRIWSSARRLPGYILLQTVALLVASGALATPAPAQVQTAADRPNVIYILLDDLGFSDVGSYGSEISTPNIDGLARDGIRYNAFENRAHCSPTRAALLTGRNNQTVGMMGLATESTPYSWSSGRGIDPAAATIAQILQANGYGTSVVGKWHLTPRAEMPDTSRSRANWPSGKGFQNFYGWLIGWTDQYNPSGIGREIMEGDHLSTAPRPPDYHVSEAIVARAIDYLKEGRARDPQQPQFLYLSFGAPHYPLQVPQRYIDNYADVYAQGWDRIREARFARQKSLGIIPADARLSERPAEYPRWEELSPEEQQVHARLMATYAGFVEHTDEQIGRLIAYLKDSGQYDNTLIFFMSDNGGDPSGGMTGIFDVSQRQAQSIAEIHARLDEIGSPTSAPAYPQPWAWVGSTPFQRYKRTPYGGGVRSPLIVTWPAVIRERESVRPQFIDVIDITPTVLDVAGVQAPRVVAGVPQMDLHGKSILDTFTDAHAPTRTTQFFRHASGRAIRHEGWRAIAWHEAGTSFDDDRWELYDLSRDYSESMDVAGQYPDKLKELQALWWYEAEKYGALPLVDLGPGGN